MEVKLRAVSERLNMCTATLLAVQAALRAQSRSEPECCKDDLIAVKTAKSYIRQALEELTMLIADNAEGEDDLPF